MNQSGVICAIDVNDFDQDVVEMAAAFAHQFDAPLELVHITLFPDPANAAWPAYLGSPDTMIQDHQRLKKIKPATLDVEIHYHHLTGTPKQKILDFVQNRDPMLLVLGTHGRSGLARLFGSVATSVLRQVDCPVMVLRQQQNSQDFDDVLPETQDEVI